MTLIRRPFPHHLRPADLGFLINMGLHRTACVWIFISMLVAVILHYLPGVTYTLTTKRGAPSAGLPSWLHISSLLASLLASGLMRRGPLLCAEIAVSAFGLSGVEARQNGDSTNGKTDGDLWDDKTRPEVIDYGNSSMIKFLALGYVSQRSSTHLTGRVSRWLERASLRPSSSRRIFLCSRNGSGPAAMSTFVPWDPEVTTSRRILACSWLRHCGRTAGGRSSSVRISRHFES